MTAPAPPTIDMHLCFSLYSTSLKMTQLYKPLLTKLNLTYPQYLVMVVLWEEEGVGIKDIANRLQQDSGSITPLVKRLEALGYLTRDRDPNDERNRVLTLTKAGKDLRSAAGKIAQTIARTCGLVEVEFIRLMGDLAKLSATLDP